MTPDQLSKIEARANAVPADEDEQAIRILANDVLALVARVQELEAKIVQRERDWGTIYDLKDARAEKAEARVKELELEAKRLVEGTCGIHDLQARVAVLREALGNLLGPIHHFQKYGDSDGVALRLIEEGTKADAALATLDPAATALTERLRAAEAVCEAADKEHQSGWSQHDRYACDVCIGIYAWKNAKGEL